MNRAVSASWGPQARLTGVAVPLFGILLGYDLPCDHSRRGTRRQRGSARSCEPRDSGASAGDEAAALNGLLRWGSIVVRVEDRAPTRSRAPSPTAQRVC